MHLNAHDIGAWLEGGWAIDALLGEQTRVHDDLTLVAPLDDSTRVERSLKEHGYIRAAGGSPLSFELVDNEGHQVDVHPVAFTGRGDGIYRMASGENWVYPAEGLPASGASSDVMSRV